MHRLTKIIREDMIPALGVTEPGAIAFAAATARTMIGGRLVRLTVSMNSGLYKNAYSCGLPGVEEVGAVFAAALGYTAGDPEKGLEALSNVGPEDVAAAGAYVAQGKITADMSEISSRIRLVASLETDEGTAEVEIRGRHTNIVRRTVNGTDVFTGKDEEAAAGENDAAEIRNLTLREMLAYAETVPAEEIGFIREAHQMNLALFEEGLRSSRTTFVHRLLEMNGGTVYSGDERKTASLLCNGAIEARVLGLNRPAMSITGSGAHGIMATLPLYAVCQVRHLPEERLLRATAMSFLICMYIKSWSGRLSALCGCALAGGTGAACGLCLLSGGGEKEISAAIRNMASGITGMICDGGNQGCVMKGIAACDAAFSASSLGMTGVSVDSVHGINGRTSEETMRNIGRIASPGMTGTEETIVGIQRNKGTDSP